jgi:aspartyl-tRNA(Asn)/glutamyl-tRNA(Gln) amidotransferase subunit C
MSVSIEEVKKIAELARLSLSEEEALRYAGELSRILEFAESIKSIDTSGVPPTTHVLEIADVWRADEPRPSIDRDAVMASAPKSEDGCFVAPRIV